MMKKTEPDDFMDETKSLFFERPDIQALSPEKQQQRWEEQKAAINKFFNAMSSNPNAICITVDDSPEGLQEIEEITKGVNPDSIVDLRPKPKIH